MAQQTAASFPYRRAGSLSSPVEVVAGWGPGEKRTSGSGWSQGGQGCHAASGRFDASPTCMVGGIAQFACPRWFRWGRETSEAMLVNVWSIRRRRSPREKSRRCCLPSDGPS